MADQMKEYTGRRGVAKGSITRLVKYADSISDRTSPVEVKARLDLLERSFIEFTECEMKLAASDVPSEMEDYETKYLRVKAKLSQALTVPTTQEDTSQVEKMMSRILRDQNEFLTSLSSTFTTSMNQTINQTCDEPRCSVRLPRLNIPTFSGDYKDFPCFKDLYTASVHSKLGLTDAEKFQYLKGYLRGEAADLIKHINVSEANYGQAWAKLCDRYDKKRYVLNTLIKVFLDQPSTHSSSAKYLRRLHNVSDEVIRGMEALGQEANGRDAWLIYLLLKKTDKDTQQAWAHKTVTKDFPSLEEFLKFISERADALEACEPTNTFNMKPSTTKVHQINMSEPLKSVSAKCLFCGDSH